MAVFSMESSEMSTRCQVIVKDEHNQIWFYRHSDGYPEGVSRTLLKFVDMVRTKQIRNNAEQSAGWLILLGAIEYQRCLPEWFAEAGRLRDNGEPSYMRVEANVSGAIEAVATRGDFKVGAYEPCQTGCVHGDIEYFYVVDLNLLEVFETDWNDDGPCGELRPLALTTAD